MSLMKCNGHKGYEAVAQAQLDKIPQEIWQILEQCRCGECGGSKVAGVKLIYVQDVIGVKLDKTREGEGLCLPCNGTGYDCSRVAILCENQKFPRWKGLLGHSRRTCSKVIQLVNGGR